MTDLTKARADALAAKERADKHTIQGENFSGVSALRLSMDASELADHVLALCDEVERLRQKADCVNWDKGAGLWYWRPDY